MPRIATIFAIHASLGSMSLAQVPMPELDALVPPGAAAGETVLVQAHGSYLDELAGVLISDPALKGSVENGQIRLEIPSGYSPRVVDVAVHGRFGLSNPHAFAIGTHHEVAEASDHSQRSAAQILTVGQTVSGTASPVAVDWFQVTPETITPIYIDVLAERIDSRMDPTVVIVDAQGNELQRHHDVRGRDVSIAFAPSTPNEPFYIGVHDFLYDGGTSYAYRLTVDHQPLKIAFPSRDPARLPVRDLPDKVTAFQADQTISALPVSLMGTNGPSTPQQLDLLVDEATPIVVEVFSERLGHPTDYRLTLSKVGDDGKLSKVSDNDDINDPVGNRRFRLGSRDPIISFKADAKVRYRLSWRDQFQSESPFRLEIRRPQPNVYLMAAAEKPRELNNQLSRWVPILRRGGTIHWEILALRRDGFDGPITIRPTALPSGVTASPLTISPGKHSGTLSLTASADAPAFVGTLDLSGELQLTEVPELRPVLGATLLWTIGDANTERWESRLTFTPTFTVLEQEMATLALTPNQTSLETSLGGQIELPFAIERALGQVGDFKSTITGLTGLAQPPEVTFNPDAKDLKFSLSLVNKDNNQFAPGDYVIHARAWEGKVKHRANPEAAERAEADRQAKEAALAPLIAAVHSLEEQKATDDQLNAAKQRLEAATKAKDDAAKRAEDEKKRAEPRDLTHAIISQPIHLKITEGPLKFAAFPQLDVVAGQSCQVPIAFERLYGFGEAVTLSLSNPTDKKLFETSNVTVAKEAADGTLKIVVYPESAPGTYETILEAKLTFNGQEITLKRPISLTVKTPNTPS